MTDRSAADELEYHVRAALKIADDLKLWAAAAALDHALVVLTGSGVLPPDHDSQQERGATRDATDDIKSTDTKPNQNGTD